MRPSTGNDTLQTTHEPSKQSLEMQRAVWVGEGSIGRIIAPIVGIVFLVSGTSKLLAWEQTQTAMSTLLGAIPGGSVSSAVLVAFELILGFALVNRLLALRLLGSIATIAFLGFTAVAVIAKANGTITECPCFGVLFSSEVNHLFVIRNAFLAVLGILVAVSSTSAIETSAGTLMQDRRVDGSLAFLLAVGCAYFFGRMLINP